MYLTSSSRSDPPLVETLWPHATGGSFRNFLADAARTETAHTAADLAGLRAVKASYDPDNFFRHGLNV